MRAQNQTLNQFFMKRTLQTLLATVASISISQASTFLVSQGGMGDYLTINEALTVAVSGDTIRVASGHYTENLLLDKTIYLIAEDTTAELLRDAGGVAVTFAAGSEGSVLDGFTIHQHVDVTTAVPNSFANRIQISHNTFINASIHASGVCLITDNRFEMFSSAIFAHNSESSLSAVYIRNEGGQPGAPAIVANNVFDSCRIYVHNSDYVDVINNRIKGYNHSNSGAVEIRGYNGQSEHVRVMANRMERCRVGIALYGYGYSTASAMSGLVANNLITNSTHYGMYFYLYGRNTTSYKMTVNVDFFNNIIYGSGSYAITNSYPGAPDSRLRFYNNIFSVSAINFPKDYYSEWRNNCFHSVGTLPVPGTYIFGSLDNISADPLFVDPANGDFRLQSGSPCIDAGRLRECMPISTAPGMIWESMVVHSHWKTSTIPKDCLQSFIYLLLISQQSLAMHCPSILVAWVNKISVGVRLFVL